MAERGGNFRKALIVHCARVQKSPVITFDWPSPKCQWQNGSDIRGNILVPQHLANGLKGRGACGAPNTGRDSQVIPSHCTLHRVEI